MSKKQEPLQHPLTEGMTDEQLREYQEMVREESRGNPSNTWSHLPPSGISYKVQEKPLSDDLGYGSYDRDEHKRLQEEHEVLEGRQDKQKLIEKWLGFIEKMKDQIKRIQGDTTMPIAVKQRKISRCLEIIKGYEFDIAQARDFIARQKASTQKMLEKYTKQK